MQSQASFEEGGRRTLDRQKRGRKYNQEGTGSNDVATSQGMPGATRN